MKAQNRKSKIKYVIHKAFYVSRITYNNTKDLLIFKGFIG